VIKKNIIEDVSVLVPVKFAGALTYKVAKDQDLSAGDFVLVPLGRREVIGVVWDSQVEYLEADKKKYIKEKIEVEALPRASRRFIDWVAEYTMAPKGLVLKMAMSVPKALDKPKPILGARLNLSSAKIRMTESRTRVLGIVNPESAIPLQELAKKAAVSVSVINKLHQLGKLTLEEITLPSPFRVPDWTSPGPTLSNEQAIISQALSIAVEKKKFEVSLLEGVPGSGKTEVYTEAICKALSLGKQALVLLPEIALSTQWLTRFRQRFGCEPIVWHSDLTISQRKVAWRSIIEGRVQVVVGARSALFLPFKNLGIVIIDEEHDTSFKQEEGVIYNARDMGIVRARVSDIPVCLVSATPSLETLKNTETGKYKRFNLEHRYSGAGMPEITIVDMRHQPLKSNNWISPDLIKMLGETFDSGQQAMLFLNRRGYAPLTLCRKCGFRVHCPNCSTWLVEHKLLGRLQCHQCGYSLVASNICSNCGAADSMAACGPGVERIAEEVDAIFPRVTKEIVTSDTLSGPSSISELVQKIEDLRVQLLIGTQIIAKGYHFPGLTLVGVVDADLGLAGGDLRASERTHQLLYQVAGRSGRSEHSGKVVIQTYMPDNPVIKALGDGNKEGFLSAEANDRESMGMPPFGRLVALIISSKDNNAADAVARELNRVAPRDNNIEILGPAEAPLRILRGWYRIRFLVKSKKEVNIQKKVRNWLVGCNIPSKVRVTVDVDPVNFL
jgi:primosomal protein N' (replication factor Y)